MPALCGRPQADCKSHLCQGVICPDNWNGLLLLNVGHHQLLQPFHVKLAHHAAQLPGHLAVSVRASKHSNNSDIILKLLNHNIGKSC